MSALKKCQYLEKSDSYMTCEGRITFFAVADRWRAKDAKPDDKGQYALTLIFPPDSDLSLIKQAAEKAAREEWGDKMPKGLKSPFLKADEKLDFEGMDFTGWTMVRANTFTSRPGVVNAAGKTVAEGDLAEAFYNGRWARMTVTVKAYNRPDNKGVKLYVNNIQVLRDDEVLPNGGPGRAKPEDEFEAVSDEAVSTGGSADSIFG